MDFLEEDLNLRSELNLATEITIRSVPGEFWSRFYNHRRVIDLQ